MEKKKLDIHKLVDLIVDIKKVDEIIKLHSHDSNDFMYSQYEVKKEKLIKLFIDELLSPSIRSEDSFSIIRLLLEKFYPENNSTPLRKSIKNNKYESIDLSLLESQLH